MSPLGEEIAGAFKRLVEVFESIPEGRRSDRVFEWTGGVVSSHDIIAYQLGWGELLLSWYKAGLQKESITMPGEGFSNWDYVGLAQHFYTKFSRVSDAHLLEMLARAVDEIITFANVEAARGQLEAVGVWPWCTLLSGKEWPLSKWVRVNTVAPYKRAISVLRKGAPLLR